MKRIKILYVGETWMGSSARSLRDGLSLLAEIDIDDIGEDQFVPIHRSLPMRILNRLSRPLQRAALEAEISSRISALRPDVLMIYKGNGINRNVISSAKNNSVLTVNIFPDGSPHNHGRRLRSAVGMYDLVISTKPFHPAGWSELYGYSNRCAFVPHGYDPKVHYWSEPPCEQTMDVVLAASWRPEYEHLLLDFAANIAGTNLRVGIIGAGWSARKKRFPMEWQISGALHGRAYGDWVRNGKIVIAPVHTQLSINGNQQPGDQDTTRTYELAAAHCFFLHRRTPFALTVYDEATEVPMWDSAEELATLVRKFLPLEGVRRKMAEAAHRRAVPAYSMPARAERIAAVVRAALVR